ncbi:MAG: HNH endonuclease [Ignavibacteriae bacterium]|nr:HNH endonuclease [Ignavibacteriota bacterium]MCB9216855.1 HNH endonuclease [Ignavibacteria bacterium]
MNRVRGVQPSAFSTAKDERSLRERLDSVPDRYESIISTRHRQQICSVFRNEVENPSANEQELLKQIKEVLYNKHHVTTDKESRYEERGVTENPCFKERWFFYLDDIQLFWKKKKSLTEQKASSAIYDVRQEEIAAELEGERTEVRGYRIQRSAKLVKEVKRRDGYPCRACGFHFKGQIVHVHHLTPLNERTRPNQTNADDLITLCPNCHYLAHYLLRESDRYTKSVHLLAKLRSIHESIVPIQEDIKNKKGDTTPAFD